VCSRREEQHGETWEERPCAGDSGTTRVVSSMWISCLLGMTSVSFGGFPRLATCKTRHSYNVGHRLPETKFPGL
jgi:hypothetical protein